MRRALAGLATAALMVVSTAGCGEDDASDAAGGSAVEDQTRVPGVFLQPDEAALSPDGSRLVVPCLSALCVWNTADGALVDEFDGGSVVAWSPDGSLIATSSSAGDKAAVRLLDADTGAEVRVLSGHDVKQVTDGGERGIAEIAFTPDGDSVASAGGDGTVRLWKVAGDELGVVSTASATPDELAFSPDGTRLAVASPDEPVQVFDVESSEVVGTLDADPQGEVVWSPDGSLLATDTNAVDSAPTVRLWDGETFAARDSRPAGVQGDGLAFSPDSGQLAYSQKNDPTVIIWPVAGDVARRLVGLDESPRAVLWSPDGSRVYTVAARSGVAAWDVASGALLRTFELPVE